MCSTPTPTSSEEFNDIEQELALFFICRQMEPVQCSKELPIQDHKQKCRKHKDRKINYCIPLLVCDIKQIKSKDGHPKTYEIFPENIRFNTCLLYGEIVCCLRQQSDKYYKFMIDDGTGTLELSLYRHKQQMLAACRMQYEIEALMQTTAQNKREISKGLLRILTKAKHELDVSNIKQGTRLLIYGNPSIFRNKVALRSSMIYRDSNVSRNLEIAYKSYLLKWYANKK